MPRWMGTGCFVYWTQMPLGVGVGVVLVGVRTEVYVWFDLPRPAFPHGVQTGDFDAIKVMAYAASRLEEWQHGRKGLELP